MTRVLLFGVALAASLMIAARAHAADACPGAQDGKRGFVVERSGSSSTQVFHVDKSTVRTVMSSGGSTLLETTQFQGLFQLERVERGQRVIFSPNSELSRLFPLRPGQQATAEFEIQETERAATKATVILNVKGKDALFIGPCRYEVLKIERSESRGDSAPRVIDTDYYSVDLKLVIGKEYKERDGRANLIKFDRIYPLER
jgi:hypothetical protein